MTQINVRDTMDADIASLYVEPGASIARAMMDEWPDGFPGWTPVMYDGAGKVLTTEEVARAVAGVGDTWTLVLRPQAAGAFLGLTYLQWGILAASLAVSFLMKPQLPNLGGDSYQWDDVEPQYLSGQTNRLRPGSRVPDVFGKIKVFPDLIAPPAIEYYGDRQTIREMYVVSNGRCDISEAGLGDEDLTTLPAGAGIRKFIPGDAFPSDFPIMKTNSVVGSIDLKAPNETASSGVRITITANLGDGRGELHAEEPDGLGGYKNAEGFFEGYNQLLDWFYLAGDVAANNTNRMQFDEVAATQSKLRTKAPFGTSEVIDGIAGTDRIQILYEEVWTSGGVPVSFNLTWQDYYRESQLNNGDFTYTFQGKAAAYSGFPPAGYDTLLDANGVRWRATVDDRYIFTAANGFSSTNLRGFFLTGPPGMATPVNPVTWSRRGSISFGDLTDAGGVLPTKGYETDAYRVPTDDDGVSEIWLDFEFPEGLWYQRAGDAPTGQSVEILISYKTLASGTWLTDTLKIAEFTRAPFRRTHKINVSPGQYEVKCLRTTNSYDDTEQRVYNDACRWVGLHGRQVASKITSKPLKVTMVELTLDTQNMNQFRGQRNFNVVAERWLPDHPNLDNTLVRTRTVAHAMLYTAIEQGGYSRPNIDVAGLNAIQADLDAIATAGTGSFHGIIDQTMTVEDQLQLIAGPSRIGIYRRGEQLKFYRLKGDQEPVFLISGRNKVEPETRQMTFSELNQPDAIIARFLDHANGWKEAAIQYPGPTALAAATGSGVPERPQEINVIGLTGKDAVWRMIAYQWEKQRRERDTVQVRITADGLLLAPGDLFAITDHLRPTLPISGEILRVEGTVFTFDQAIPAGTYAAARIRGRNGAILHNTVPLTIATTSAVQNIAQWTGVNEPDPLSQVGLLYSFTPAGDEAFKDVFTVAEVVPDSDMTVLVTGISYRQATYASDTATPDPEEPIG